MSRSAEEQQLLDERIEAMKRKNEELRRRHMEVEEDKRSAAKQNALVSVNVPHDDDWIPGRHDDSPRKDRHQHDESASNQELSHENRPRFDHRRNKNNEGHQDEGSGYSRQNDEPMSKFRPVLQNSTSNRKSDFQANRQKSDGNRFYGPNENRRSGDWSVNQPNDGFSARPREWGSQNSRSYRGNQHSGAGDGPKPYSSGSTSSTFTSKVYKNSSMDPDRGKRPTYRLAEGDGPPPDPSYSFLGDSMRDSPESSDKRKSFTNRRGSPRARGRGGQTCNNRGFHDTRKDGFEDQGEMHPSGNDDAKQQSYDAWRRERSLIDQERINRQKTSDGHWSREWDNNKVIQEGSERPNRWRRGNHNPNYNRGHAERGYHDESNNSPKPYYKHGDDTVPNSSSQEVGTTSENSPPRSKYTRRGRFTHHSRAKDPAKFSNGSVQDSFVPESEVKKETEGAAFMGVNAESGELLKVSLLSDPVVGQVRRSVEGVGGSLRISVSGELSEGKNSEQKRSSKNLRKGKRARVLSSTSTGTTGTGEDDDGSWEDVSSEEENVSVLTELQKIPFSDLSTFKSNDVSSGPESLDPIPVPGKEDEFLWDDFHPAGFQDNVTPEMEAEAAYKALLDEKAKQEVNTLGGMEGVSLQQQQVSFRLDTSCLDDSSDELEGAKLDPLLVTTQIVQAEVDCMSLTSLPPDTSLPDETNLMGKMKSMHGEKIPEEGACPDVRDTTIHESTASAEELSGPVSILDVTPKELTEAKIEELSDNSLITSDDHSKANNSNPKSSEAVVKEVVHESTTQSEDTCLETVKETQPSHEGSPQEQVDFKDKEEIFSGLAADNNPSSLEIQVSHEPDFPDCKTDDSKMIQDQKVDCEESLSVPENSKAEEEVMKESLKETSGSPQPVMEVLEEFIEANVMPKPEVEQIQDQEELVTEDPALESLKDKLEIQKDVVEEDKIIGHAHSENIDSDKIKEVPVKVDPSVDVSHAAQEEGTTKQ